MFVLLSVYTHFQLSVCLSICLFVCLSVCLSVCLFVGLSVCSFISLFCLSVCLFVCLSVCLFIRLSVCLFVYSFVYLLIYLNLCRVYFPTVCSFIRVLYSFMFICSFVCFVSGHRVASGHDRVIAQHRRRVPRVRAVQQLEARSAGRRVFAAHHGGQHAADEGAHFWRRKRRRAARVWRGKYNLLCNATLSLPRVINIKFPLQPHQQYNITQYGELGFS